jgi:hypothetical protein
MMDLAPANRQEEDKITHIIDNTSSLEPDQKSLSDYL